MTRPVKQSIKDLKLPGGKDAAYSSNEYNETYNWNRRGGHAGDKTISKVVAKAKSLGWELKGGGGSWNSVTGDTVTNRSEYMNPAKTVVLYVNSHYGQESSGNRYTITLRLINTETQL